MGVGGVESEESMPVFRMCWDPPPWEAERTSLKPVHALLVKRAAEKAKRAVEKAKQVV